MSTLPATRTQHPLSLLGACLWLAGMIVLAGCGNASPTTAGTKSAPTGTLAATAPAPTPSASTTAVSTPGTPVPTVPVPGSVGPRSATPRAPWQSYIRAVTLTPGANPDTLDPLGETAVYASTQHEFHCIVSFADAPAGTQLRAQWYYHKAEGVTDNYLIDDANTVVGGTGNVDFNLYSRNDWALGTYRVQVWAEDELVKVILFAVKK